MVIQADLVEIKIEKIIAIAGNMGGKSTMVEYLHQQYAFKPVYEPFMDNHTLMISQGHETVGIPSSYFLTHDFVYTSTA